MNELLQPDAVNAINNSPDVNKVSSYESYAL